MRVFLDVPPAAESAIPLPRMVTRAPVGERPLPFGFICLDRERRLPVIVPARKAAQKNHPEVNACKGRFGAGRKGCASVKVTVGTASQRSTQ